MKNENLNLQEKIDKLKKDTPKMVKRFFFKELRTRYGYKPGTTLVVKDRVKLSKNAKASFDDEQAKISVGKYEIELPPTKNEHFLCKAMFLYGVGEAVDWSIVYEHITGYYRDLFGKPLPSRQNWRIVYDTTGAVNKRFQERFGEDLFVWQEKTIKRLR